MIKRVSHVNVFVLDQDRAKRFYTEQLGFEVRNDSILDLLRDVDPAEDALPGPGPTIVPVPGSSEVRRGPARLTLGQCCRDHIAEEREVGVRLGMRPPDGDLGTEKVARGQVEGVPEADDPGVTR